MANYERRRESENRAALLGQLKSISSTLYGDPDLRRINDGVRACLTRATCAVEVLA